MKIFFLLIAVLMITHLFSDEQNNIIEESSISLFKPKIEREDPKDFIISYYDNIKIIPASKSYNLLSTRFKENNGSYNEYLNYINSYETIKVIKIDILETSSDNHKTKFNTTVEYQYKGSSYKESYVLTLVYQDDVNSWIFY